MGDIQQIAHQEQHHERSRTRRATELDAAVAVHDDRFTVELERTTLTAEHRESGGERTIDISEDVETDTFAVAFVEANYADVLPAPQEVIAGALAAPAPDTVSHDAVPHVPMPVPEPALPRPVPDTSPVPLNTHERPRAAPTIERSTAEPDPYTFAEPDPVEGVPQRAAEPSYTRDKGTASTTAAPTVAPGTLALDGLDSVDHRGDVTVANYDGDHDVSTRLVTHAREGTTAMGRILELAEAGQVEATIVEQPYFSPRDEDGAAEGWNSDHWFVQLDGMDVDRTEISTGRDPSLASGSIAEERLAPGDVLQVDEADRYACGTIEPDPAIVAAWDDRFRWYADDQKRAVYAALASGSEFMGSTFDLAAHGMHDVRRDFIADFGVAPEAVVDNVAYSGADAASGYVPA